MSTDRTTKDKLSTLKMMQGIGQSYSRDNSDLGAYFMSVDSDDIVPQRRARDDFSHRLELARTTPQVVTVRARGNNPGGDYVILSAERVAQMASAASNKPATETLTCRMRRLRNEMAVDIPVIDVPRSRRPRSTTPRVSGSSQDT